MGVGKWSEKADFEKMRFMDGPFMGSYEKVNGVANHDTCKECLMSIYHVTQLPLLFLVIYYMCVTLLEQMLWWTPNLIIPIRTTIAHLI